MPRRGPAGALEAINEVVDIASPPRSAREIVAQICLAYGWAESSEAAAEIAEKWEQPFLKYARKELNSLLDLGRQSRYTFNSSSDYMLQGPAFIEPSDDEPLRETKLRLQQSGAYTESLAALTSRQFEILCGRVLELLGVREPVITRQTGDEGIDFHGQAHLEDVVEEPIPNVYRQLRVWMVGQAKQYPTGSVSTFEIRELVGAVELARGRAFSFRETDMFESLDVKPCDAVFYLFITTGTLSPPSWNLIRKSGVVAMDGGMLAAFLASRGIACDAAGIFAASRLVDWINESE